MNFKFFQIIQNIYKTLYRLQEYIRILTNQKKIFYNSLQYQKTHMDTKNARRNFYHMKIYLSEKHDQEYTTQRFSQDIRYLLVEFIPKANVKQLRKFMQKKYNRILKKLPQVEKPLKKVLFDRLNKIPTEIKKTQIQKILQFIKSCDEKRELISVGQNQYKFTFEGTTNWIHSQLEGIKIMQPRQKHLMVDQTQRSNSEKGFIKLIYKFANQYREKVIVSSYTVEQQKFYFVKGNFERVANNFLEKLDQFYQRMNYFENQQNPEESCQKKYYPKNSPQRQQ